MDLTRTPTANLVAPPGTLELTTRRRIHARQDNTDTDAQDLRAVAKPVIRFDLTLFLFPLFEPGWQISRIRLSEKTHVFAPRRFAPSISEGGGGNDDMQKSGSRSLRNSCGPVGGPIFTDGASNFRRFRRLPDFIGVPTSRCAPSKLMARVEMRHRLPWFMYPARSHAVAGILASIWPNSLSRR
jgi:hypothetical protein